MMGCRTEQYIKIGKIGASWLWDTTIILKNEKKKRYIRTSVCYIFECMKDAVTDYFTWRVAPLALIVGCMERKKQESF